MKHSRFLCVMFLLAATTLLVANCGGGDTSMAHAEWSYSGATGPSSWGALSPLYLNCASSTRQSPIDITGAVNDNTLSPISFAGIHAHDVDLINNGHTIEQEYSAGSTISFKGKTWTLLQFHFHTQSEHQIAGIASPMEAHFVFKDNASSNLLVIGMMINTGPSNAFLALFENTLPANKGDHVANTTSLDPTTFLTSGSSYWTYDGSLTTPPCSPIVTWVFLKTPATATAAQIQKFATIMHSNFRPVQPINGRIISQTP